MERLIPENVIQVKGDVMFVSQCFAKCQLVKGEN
jgi:hypothetical protein